MRIIDIPIEPIEERYSKQWAGWFPRVYFENQINRKQIIPITKSDFKINTGVFLDVFDTNRFKMLQLAQMIKLIQSGDIGRDDDWFLFHDLWFPGIQTLAYIRDGAGLRFKIAGCLHAGTWDRNDFLSQKGMTLWARSFETSILELTNLIFVATEYHKNLILKTHPHFDDKIRVTGFPIYTESLAKQKCYQQKPRNLIVFPHRLNPEKQPFLFSMLKSALENEGLNNLDFIKTKERAKNKDHYYQLLASATIAVSFALQETWGIAMQEALFLGCIPFVPDRLSYVEMYHPDLRFTSLNELVGKIKEVIRFKENEARSKYERAAKETERCLKHAGENAIQNMLNCIKEY